MPKVFNFSKLILWCSQKFDSTKRVIKVGEGGKAPIHLCPYIFQKMLRFPMPSCDLELSKVNSFIANNGGGQNILEQFLRTPIEGRTNPCQIEIGWLDKPYREFPWIFTPLVRQDSTTCISRYVLYVIHLTFIVGIDFEWG